MWVLVMCFHHSTKSADSKVKKGSICRPQPLCNDQSHTQFEQSRIENAMTYLYQCRPPVCPFGHSFSTGNIGRQAHLQLAHPLPSLTGLDCQPATLPGLEPQRLCLIAHCAQPKDKVRASHPKAVSLRSSESIQSVVSGVKCRAVDVM